MNHCDPQSLDPSKFAIPKKGSRYSWEKMIDDDGVQLFRARNEAGSLEVDGLPSHIISMHTRPAAVRARFADKRFTGVSKRGDMSLCPKGALMRISWQQPVDVLVLYLSPGIIARLLEIPRFDATPFCYNSSPMLSHVFALLAQNAAAGEPYGRLFRDGLITSLAAAMAGSRTQARYSTAARGDLPPLRLRRVLDFIESYLVDDISLAVLAAQAGVSERHFCTLFHRVMGRPPHRYIIERRLERAKLSLLLAKQDTTITEIAMSVGFKSSAHFSTMFRKLIGMTPSDFRRES